MQKGIVLSVALLLSCGARAEVENRMCPMRDERCGDSYQEVIAMIEKGHANITQEQLDSMRTQVPNLKKGLTPENLKEVMATVKAALFEATVGQEAIQSPLAEIKEAQEACPVMAAVEAEKAVEPVTVICEIVNKEEAKPTVLAAEDQKTA